MYRPDNFPGYTSLSTQRLGPHCKLTAMLKPSSLALPRAVLFDLDGTLADTAPDLMGVVQRFRMAGGLGFAPDELLRPHVSAGAGALITAGLGVRPGDEGFDAWSKAFLDNYAEHLADKTRLFDGIAALLARLQAMGVLWGVVTNKPMRFTDALVPLIGLQGAACVISGDTTPHAKPHPEPLFEAARRMGLAPADCWYVGDDLRDIQAGKAAGMATIAAGWGYCGAEAPKSWQADFVALQPAYLEALLLRYFN